MNADNLVFSRNNPRPIEQDEAVGRRAGIFIALGLFATPYVLRHRIIPGSEAVWALNPLVLLSVAWLLLYMLGHKYSMSRGVSVVRFVLFAGLVFLAFSTGMSISYLISCLFPLVLLLIVIPETIFPSLFEGFMRVLNVVMVIIVACAACDLVSGSAVSKTFTAFYGSASLVSMSSSGRLVSIMGHSLLTAEVALLYFALSHIANRAMGIRVNQVLVTLITAAVVLLTGSRSAMVCLLCMFILAYSNAGNIKYCIVIIFGLLAFYLAGLFDTMIDRIMIGIKTGDMTSSRNVQLDQLIAAGIIRYEWFAGHEFDYSNGLLVIALEYPLLRFAFSYGIAFAVLLGIYLFLFPLMQTFRSLGAVPCGLLALYFVHVNTYSSICSTQDGMLQCVIVAWLFIGVARYLAYLQVSRSTEPGE